MIKNIVNIIDKTFLQIKDLVPSYKLIKHNNKFFKSKSWNNGEILLELNQIKTSYIPYSYASSVLSNIYNSKIIGFNINNYSVNNYFLFIIKKFFFNEFKIYRSFGVSSFIFFKRKKFDEKVLKLNDEIYKKINNLEDLEKLTIYGVKVGDLIYDSYLRKNINSSPDLDSSDFKIFFKNSICTFVNFWEYFKNHKIKAVIVSHCVYMTALPLRIALEKNIAAFQVTKEKICKVNKNNPHGYAEFRYYKNTFKEFPENKKIEAKKLSKERIKKRFKGEVGIDMSYSNKSAFGPDTKNRLIKKSKNIKILIASHCFFDSPHSYGDFLFTDFNQWLKFLGDLSEVTNYDWYIKTHPDFILETRKRIKHFCKKYKKFNLLPAESSHHQIIKEGIDFALTVYGTIGFEYAALGIPVINASPHNPHINYDFNYTPKNLEQYKSALMDLKNFKLDINYQEILEFYYMKNLYHNKDIFFDNKSLYQYLENNDLNNSKVYNYWIENFRLTKHEEILNIIKKGILDDQYVVGTHYNLND